MHHNVLQKTDTSAERVGLLGLVALNALLIGSLRSVRLLVMWTRAAAQVALVVENRLLGFGSSTVLGVVLFVKVTGRKGLDTFLENRSCAATTSRLLGQLVLVVLAILLLGKVSSHLQMARLPVIWH